MAISNLFGLIKDPLKAAYDKYGPQYKEDLSTIGQFAKESAQPAVDFVANAPIVKSASAFLDNPTPQELGAQVAYLGGVGSDAAQQYVEDFKQMPFLGGMVAYHGTPHKIVGGFKKEAIGSGEGAQAFGHGFYATDAQEIAETYARKLSGGNLFYKGYGYIEPNFTPEVKEVLDIVNRQKAKDLKEAFDLAEKEIRTNKWAGKLQRKTLKKLREMDGFEWNPTGRVYTLDIPESDVMLDWDKPLSEQPKAVIEKLQPAIDKVARLYPAIKTNPKATGAGLLRGLSDYRGGNLAGASEELSKLGIKGIKYRAGHISGAKTDASNYVIFEPEDIKITAEEFLDK